MILVFYLRIDSTLLANLRESEWVIEGMLLEERRARIALMGEKQSE